MSANPENAEEWYREMAAKYLAEKTGVNIGMAFVVLDLTRSEQVSKHRTARADLDRKFTKWQTENL